jgi:hypothetical protein
MARARALAVEAYKPLLVSTKAPEAREAVTNELHPRGDALLLLDAIIT